VLDTSRALLLLTFCISQDSVVTHLRCGGKMAWILLQIYCRVQQ